MLYRHFVLHMPKKTLLLMLAAGVFFLFQAGHFFLDASSDSLMLENDPELIIYREIAARYESSSLMVLTFTPHDSEIFTTNGLKRLRRLREEIKSAPHVDSVITLLDVPLFRNPPVPLAKVSDNIRTLDDPETDIVMAKSELLASEAYKQQLISNDGKTALLAIMVASSPELEEVRDRRTQCQLAIDKGIDVQKNRAEYNSLTPRLRELQKNSNNNIRAMISGLRAIVKPWQSEGTLYLGGGLMVSDDMLSFIRSDLKIFGIAVFIAIALILTYLFRSLRWVLAAVLCCAYSTIVMVGILGLFEWPVTVISSNFISLLLIMNMSLVIHLVVQYRELAGLHPDMCLADLVSETVARKWTPSLFTTLTTIAGFGSLVLCDIKPVKDFGLMMSLALVVSIMTSFVLFPSLLMLFKKEDPGKTRAVASSLIRQAAFVAEKRGRWIWLSTLLVVVFVVFGIARLTVENSFVNHFKKSSEIYRGMVFIDRQLGGTTPLDILINLPVEKSTAQPPQQKLSAGEKDEFDEFEEFDNASTSAQYWYTPAKLEVLRKAHAIVESQPEVGKVWSFATLARVMDMLNEGVPLDAFDLAIMAGKLPDYARKLLVDPYVSVTNNQFLITARVFDSSPELRRDAFLKRLTKELNDGLGLPQGSVVVNGTLVLYNSVLQSLFQSQILTLGVVFVILLFMFIVLFRSLKLALIALFPNLISALMVLGLLGALGIPLDIMTITIASISIGIAVDDTIHYIVRFREEFEVCGCYLQSLRASHRGVGCAMYYTSVTIVCGFMLLVFSNFVPSILFGVLSSAAMVVALFGALTLLPRLLLTFKPFGPERNRDGVAHSVARCEKARGEVET